MSHTPTTGCGCCLEPVDDASEACDLCSEATGMDDGVGWRIRQCRLHAAAPDLLAACKGLLTFLERCRQGGLSPTKDYSEFATVEFVTQAAIAKATSRHEASV